MDKNLQVVRCRDCRLQSCPGLRPLSGAQIGHLEELKQGETRLSRGDLLLRQGEVSTRLHTVYNGVLMRSRVLEDGRRQIVNFMFPGDLVGLQSAFDEPSGHSIEALTNATVCDFRRSDFHQLIMKHPELGYDITWLAAKEERALEEHIVSLGQRTAKERVTHLAVWLLDRAIATCVARNETTLALPLTQGQIADMLGLSLVHTNRTLRALAEENMVIWRSREITVPDLKKACDYAHFEREGKRGRPFI